MRPTSASLSVMKMGLRGTWFSTDQNRKPVPMLRTMPLAPQHLSLITPRKLFRLVITNQQQVTTPHLQRSRLFIAKSILAACKGCLLERSMNYLLKLLGGCLIISCCSVQASVVLGGTRIIYPSNKSEVQIALKNKDPHTRYLVQSWVSYPNDA